MSKVDVSSFLDAEQALLDAATGLKQIKSSSSTLSNAEEKMTELLKACDAIVKASEVLRSKGAEAMSTISELDLKGSLERLTSSVRIIERALSQESKDALQRHVEQERSVREIRASVSLVKTTLFIGLGAVIVLVPLLQLLIHRAIK